MSAGSRWERFWFAPTSLVRLALFRIGVLSLALADLTAYARTALSDAAAVSAGQVAKTWRPIYLFEVLGLQPIEHSTAQLIYVVGLLAIVCGILGIFTRSSCAVAALVSIYLTGLVYSFGKAHHDKVALAFALAALPLAPVGARLSIDALRARWRRVRAGGDPREVPVESELAALPIRLTQVTLAIGYFLAAASKLWISGPGWANGYTLMGHLVRHDNAWSAAFTSSVELCIAISVGTLLVQGSFPLVFAFPRSRWFYLPAATGFHLSTWFTMDTGPYITLWFLLIAFLPLQRIPGWIGAAARPWSQRAFRFAAGAAPSALVLWVFVLYLPDWVFLALIPPVAAALLACLPSARMHVFVDGAATRCRLVWALFEALDWAHRLEIHDLHDDAARAAHLPGVPEAQVHRALHAVDASGRVSAGPRAIVAVLRRLPLTCVFGPLLVLPPFTLLQRRLVEWMIAAPRVAQAR